MIDGTHPTAIHECAAPNCDIDIPVGRFMCQGHWFSLPAHIRRRVTGRWMAWQHDMGDADKMASYRRVCREAIEALA